jgi:hypothetical protein
MDEMTHQILSGNFSTCDRVAADGDECLRIRRQQQLPPKPEPEPPPAPTFTAAQRAALQDMLGTVAEIVADETGRVDKALMKRIERLERFEEIQQLQEENKQLREKAAQLERRVVFVDLSKTHATGDDDVVVDLDAARSAVRGRDVA